MVVNTTEEAINANILLSGTMKKINIWNKIKEAKREKKKERERGRRERGKKERGRKLINE